jgi:hypothetical protein
MGQVGRREWAGSMPITWRLIDGVEDSMYDLEWNTWADCFQLLYELTWFSHEEFYNFPRIFYHCSGRCCRDILPRYVHVPFINPQLLKKHCFVGAWSCNGLLMHELQSEGLEKTVADSGPGSWPGRHSMPDWRDVPRQAHCVETTSFGEEQLWSEPIRLSAWVPDSWDLSGTERLDLLCSRCLPPEVDSWVTHVSPIGFDLLLPSYSFAHENPPKRCHQRQPVSIGCFHSVPTWGT